MKKVITYGTFDHLHQGHINVLKNAKKLGDYLIVGITSDNFDMKRGKINVDENLSKRIENVKQTGLADEIIIEEYEGQKIDDIIKYHVDVFTVGSDWVGKFDYLNKYCKVIYSPRTEGVSSTEIRSKNKQIKIGMIGNAPLVKKFYNEAKLVNGVQISGVYDNSDDSLKKDGCVFYDSLKDLISNSDAIYVCSRANKHYKHAKFILEHNKHCLVSAPLALTENELDELYTLSEKNHLVFMEANKTAYSTAFYRMILLIQGGIIGDVVSVSSTCTSLEKRNYSNFNDESTQGSVLEWSPVALLPIFKILGTNYKNINIVSKLQSESNIDEFTQIFMVFEKSCATALVGSGVKSEGELIISGTKGYIYVPAPWWKSEIFEVRYEDTSKKRVFYYRNDGEGIRYEIAAFVDALTKNYGYHFISKNESYALVKFIEEYNNGNFVKI